MVAHVAEDQGAGHNAPDGELAALRCEAEPLVAHLQHLTKTANKPARQTTSKCRAQRQKSHKESEAELTSMSLNEPAVVRLS